MEAQTVLSPFEWASQHVALVGWPTLLYFGVRLAVKATKAITIVEQQALKTVGQIDVMATNCFPTMQRSLESIDENIQRLADKVD